MKRQRRRILIDQPVQGGIALRLSVYWFCTIITAFVLLVVVQCILDPSTPFFAQLDRAKSTAFPLLAAFLLMLPVVLRDLTRLTNRFAGPVYSLKRAMRELREGKLRAELKFRKGDYWHDLADEFNALAKQLEALKEHSLRMGENVPVAAGLADE
jgi:hypothetical protein